MCALALGVESGNDVLATQAAVFLVMVTLAAGDTDGARYLAGRTLVYVERYPYWESTGRLRSDRQPGRGRRQRGRRRSVDRRRGHAAINGSSAVWPLVRSMHDGIVDASRAISAERYEQLLDEGGELGPASNPGRRREVLG